MASTALAKEAKGQGGSSTMLRMYNVSEFYQILDQVGRGTYGSVFKVKGLKDGHWYAIKKLQNNDQKLQQQGFPITALRGMLVIESEISLLKQIDHPNIIKLKEIIVSKPSKRNLHKGSTFLVFEYMDHDFAGLFKKRIKFSPPEVKCIIRQLLEGVAYLHRNKILHRDIKSANILMSDDGEVKLADFGLGRKIRFENYYTYKVVTLWYRAPQLLLGCKTYSDKIDVWSVGCVVVEFFTGEVLFKKQTEYAQMQRIYEIIGDFEANDMTVSQEYPKIYSNYQELGPRKKHPKELSTYLKKLCPHINDIAIDFIEGLLHLNPSKRMSCEEALRHPFFSEKPLACKPAEVQKMEDRSMKIDRNVKIQRVVKKKEHETQNIGRPKELRREHHDNNGHGVYLQKRNMENRDRPIDSKYRDPRDPKGYRPKDRVKREEYPYRHKNSKTYSEAFSSISRNSDSYSSSSLSSDYSSSEQSRRSRYEYHRRDSKDSRDRKYRHYHRGAQGRRIERREEKRLDQRVYRQRRGKDEREERPPRHHEEKRYVEYRDDSRKYEPERRKDYREDNSQSKKEDRKYERRQEYLKRDERKLDKRQQRRDDSKMERREDWKSQRKDERKQQKREDRKQERRDERKQDRREYHVRKQDWMGDGRRYEKYQRAGSVHESKERKFYQQRDYKRRQQKMTERNSKDKYQGDKHEYVAYERRADKSYHGKLGHRRDSVSSGSETHNYKRDKDYRHKNYHYQPVERKPYYKKQHQPNHEHRSR